MGDEPKIKMGDTKDTVRKLLGVDDSYSDSWDMFEYESKRTYPSFNLDPQTTLKKMNPKIKKNAIDTIVGLCKDHMNLDEKKFAELVEWKLWQLHRAAARQRSQSRGGGSGGAASGGGSEAASGGGSEAASGETSGGASGGGSWKPYDPVRDV